MQNNRLNTNIIERLIKKLIIGQTITIKFMTLKECIEKTGMILKIDKKEQILYLSNMKVNFTSIVAIKPLSLK